MVKYSFTTFKDFNLEDSVFSYGDNVTFNNGNTGRKITITLSTTKNDHCALNMFKSTTAENSGGFASFDF